MRLFIGDDWAEDHHDVEVMDAAGKVLAKARLPEGVTIEALARMHKTLIWDRTRHIQRLRHKLREYFPAALAAFEDLAASDVLELLASPRPSSPPMPPPPRP